MDALVGWVMVITALVILGIGLYDQHTRNTNRGEKQ